MQAWNCKTRSTSDFVAHGRLCLIRPLLRKLDPKRRVCRIRVFTLGRRRSEQFHQPVESLAAFTVLPYLLQVRRGIPIRVEACSPMRRGVLPDATRPRPPRG